MGWRSESAISWAHHRHKAAAGVFRGPAPNRYLFTVFAVKIDKLDVKAATSAAVVGFNLHFNALAKAKIMGLHRVVDVRLQ